MSLVRGRGNIPAIPWNNVPLENTLYDDSTDHLLIILLKCLFLLTLVAHFIIYCLQQFVPTKIIITASVCLSL